MVLVANLEGKSAALKPPALASLFNMNNVHYVAKAVKRSPLGDLLGPEWISRHERQWEASSEEFMERSWGVLAALLKGEPEGGGGVKAGLLSRDKKKEALKAKFRAVNEHLDALHAAQSQWSVPDAELRAELKRRIRERVVPAYTALVQQHTQVPFSKNMDKYIRYSPRDLDGRISDLFESRGPG